MNGDSEKFDVKMVVLKYVRHESFPSRFEFIADEQDQTLADLVVPSLRNDFKTTEDKHFVLESKDGQMQLFKILKSLKLYNWRLLTSNAYPYAGSNSSVETVFYYEKSLGASQPAPVPAPAASVVSKYSYNLKRTPATSDSSNHNNNVESSSGKTGIEEEKSAGSYTKPTPSVLNRYVPTPAANTTNNNTHHNNTNSTTHAGSATHSEESAGQSEADYSLKRVSTNREKLLQKYNQHRRLSLGKSADQTEAPPSPTRAAAVNKPVFGSTNTGNSASFSGTSSASAAVSAANSAASSGGASGGASVPHVNTNTTFASTPPPTPLTTSTTAATFSPTNSTTTHNTHGTSHTVPSTTATANNSSTNYTTSNTSSTIANNTNATTTSSNVHASEAPKLSAAGAYPSLVRRVSATKGFVQVSSTTNTSTTATSGTTGGVGSSASGGDVTPKAVSRVPSSSGLDSHSHSNSFTQNNNSAHTNNTSNTNTAHTNTTDEAATRPAPFTLKHTTPAPPTAPLPASIATAAAAAHTSNTSNTSSSGSNSSTTVPVVSAPDKAAATTSAPTLSVTQPTSTAASAEEESQDEPVLRISSHNPLTAPSRAVQQSITPPTPEADQHEVSRTNHYSKLGSAFFSGNALGPGARRSGGRGGGYLNSLNK